MGLGCQDEKGRGVLMRGWGIWASRRWLVRQGTAWDLAIQVW
jgi:hypothetical protein